VVVLYVEGEMVCVNGTKISIELLKNRYTEGNVILSI